LADVAAAYRFPAFEGVPPAKGVDKAVRAGRQRQDILVRAVVDELGHLAGRIERVDLALRSGAEKDVAHVVDLHGEDVLRIVRLENRLHLAGLVAAQPAVIAADAGQEPSGHVHPHGKNVLVGKPLIGLDRLALGLLLGVGVRRGLFF